MSELTTPEIKFKNWTPVCSWSYKVDQETCAICRNDLQSKCLECQTQTENSACQVFYCFILDLLGYL